MDVLSWEPHRRVPPHQRVRRKPMQVLCLGLSRTGTMATYAGLTKLGYTPYHASEMGLDAANDSLQYWTQATNAKYRGKGKPWQGKDFEKLLWRYDAVSDIPCVLFTDELLEAYPNAKVILTTRDVDSWVQSMRAVFYPILSWWGWLPLQVLDRSWTRMYIPLLRLPVQVWSGTSTTNSSIPDPELLRTGFQEHYAHVRKVVPKDRLLEWHPRDGWEPLCKHLGIDVPEEYKRKPFPKTNEPPMTLGILAMVYKSRWIVVGVQTAKWAAVGGLSYAAWKYWDVIANAASSWRS